MKVNGIDFDRVLHCAYFTPIGYHKHKLFRDYIDWGLTTVGIGPPGSIKSVTKRNFARRVGADYFALKPGEMGDGAFGVTPVPDMIKNVLRFPRPDWAENFTNEEVLALVHADEIFGATPVQQAGIMSLLLDKTIGSAVLGPRVRIMGDTNDISQIPQGYEPSMATANRIVWIENWPDPPIADHNMYLLRGGPFVKVEQDNTFSAAAEEARVMKEWPAMWAKQSGLFTAFTSRMGDEYARTEPTNKDAPRGFVTPRSKEMCLIILTSAAIHGLSLAETDLLIEGCVGESFAVPLRQFVQQQDLPDFGDLLDGKAPYVHTPERLDRINVILNGCAALIAPMNAPRRMDRAKFLWTKIMPKIVDDAAEVTLGVATEVLQEAGLSSMPEANAVLAKLNPLQRLGKK